MSVVPSLRCLVREKDGIAATEFALIAPILILIFMAAVELPRFVMVNQNLSRATRTMADIIARGDLKSVDDVYQAGRVVSAPFDTTKASIVLTAVGVYAQNNNFVARVCSSVQRNGVARAVASTVTPIPPAEEKDRARYVIVELTADYIPVFSILPVLHNYKFSKQVSWPVRYGKSYNGMDEIVLPDGKPCPNA